MEGYFVGAELKDDIYIEVVFEIVPEFNNVGMVQALMDFNFTHKFELGLGLGEGGFLDNFDRLHILGFFRDQFVAPGKPSLTQEIPLDVSGRPVTIEVAIFNK